MSPRTARMVSRLWHDDGVRDDGVDFDPEAARDGSGIRGMADRLEAVGVTLEVPSTPGVGTSVIGHALAEVGS
jgi:signal transduction histidine kinase